MLRNKAEILSISLISYFRKSRKISAHTDNSYYPFKNVIYMFVWMSKNFARFHEILNQTVAENFSVLSWQTKFFYSYKKFEVYPVPFKPPDAEIYLNFPIIYGSVKSMLEFFKFKSYYATRWTVGVGLDNFLFLTNLFMKWKIIGNWKRSLFCSWHQKLNSRFFQFTNLKCCKMSLKWKNKA